MTLFMTSRITKFSWDMLSLTNGSVLLSVCWIASWQGSAAVSVRKGALQSLPWSWLLSIRSFYPHSTLVKHTEQEILYSPYILQTRSLSGLWLHSYLDSVLKIEPTFRVIWTRIMQFAFPYPIFLPQDQTKTNDKSRKNIKQNQTLQVCT